MRRFKFGLDIITQSYGVKKYLTSHSKFPKSGHPESRNVRKPDTGWLRQAHDRGRPFDIEKVTGLLFIMLAHPLMCGNMGQGNNNKLKGCLKSEITKVWISDKLGFQEFGFQTLLIVCCKVSFVFGKWLL